MHLIKPFDIERFKNARLEAKLRPTSVNIELRAVKATFGYAVKWGVLEKSPSASVRQVRIPETAPVFLSQEQAPKVPAQIQEPGIRDIVTFALHTGMRLGEILDLRWQDADLES